MHPDEIVATAEQVTRLLEKQAPHLAGPLVRVRSSGTDHVLYRLGDDLVVRLPRTAEAAGQVAHDARCLPLLAGLPFAIPVPVLLGGPDAGYPWPWSVQRWLAGEDATVAPPTHAAEDLAGLLVALRGLGTVGGPVAGPEDRGGLLAPRDETFRECLAQVRGDTAALGRIWAEARDAAPWAGAPVWCHGDLLPGNLLVRAGRIVGVLDWGTAALGDPAVDLLCAWSVLDDDGRETLRRDVDAATWARGRGWAVSQAVIALPYYRESNPGLAAVARRTLVELLGGASVS